VRRLASEESRRRRAAPPVSVRRSQPSHETEVFRLIVRGAGGREAHRSAPHDAARCPGTVHAKHNGASSSGAGIASRSAVEKEHIAPGRGAWVPWVCRGREETRHAARKCRSSRAAGKSAPMPPAAEESELRSLPCRADRATV
jgi:hypothetical protein